MKKIFTHLLPTVILLTVGFASVPSHAAEDITLSFGGHNRSYVRYVPAGLNATDPVNLLFIMHGINQQAKQFAEMINSKANCDAMALKHNSILIFPQALPEHNSALNTMYQALTGTKLTAAWSSGTGVEINPDTLNPFLLAALKSSLSEDRKYLVVNKNVNDTGFINQIILETQSSFNVNTDSIYMLGVSMGGSMTYCYGWHEGTQIKAAAVISGYLGKALDTSKPFNVPLLHFHSHSDEVVPYNGAKFNIAIPDVMKLLADKNNHPDPAITEIPNTTNDGFTVKLRDYNTKEPQLSFYEITGGTNTHATVLGLTVAPSDINTIEIIWDFFKKPRQAPNSIEHVTKNNALKLYPNPAADFVFMPETGKFRVTNLTGKTLLSGTAQAGDKIGIYALPKGIYIFINNGSYCKFLKH